jgi:hypothetical protein
VPRAIMLGEPRLTQSEQVHSTSPGASALPSRLVSSAVICNNRSPDGPVLLFTPAECQAFLGGLQFSDSIASEARHLQVGLGLPPTLPAVVTIRGTISTPHLTCHLERKLVRSMQRACCPHRASNRWAVVARLARTARHPGHHVNSRLQSRITHQGTKPTSFPSREEQPDAQPSPREVGRCLKCRAEPHGLPDGV